MSVAERFGPKTETDCGFAGSGVLGGRTGPFRLHRGTGNRPAAPDGPEDDGSRRPPLRGQRGAICSAEIAAGIDMSLHVVSRLLGKEVAEKTAKQMQYPHGGKP